MMNIKLLRKKFREKSRMITYPQVGAYLARKKMPQQLIEACVRFLKGQACENGESFVGPKTIQSIIKGDWCLSEQVLEGIYHQNPLLIHQYVHQVTCDPDMPPMSELIRPVESCSDRAQWAYIFLSESALRVIYSALYEPDYVWKAV